MNDLDQHLSMGQIKELEQIGMEADNAKGEPLFDLTPNWVSTLRWTAETLAQHGFRRDSYEPVVSLMEMAVKVHADDPETFKKICADLTLVQLPYGRTNA